MDNYTPGVGRISKKENWRERKGIPPYNNVRKTGISTTHIMERR